MLNLILSELSNGIESESVIFNNPTLSNRNVLELLEECNGNIGSLGSHMITTFDFSALYTALPHDDIIRFLVALYNKYFMGDVGVMYTPKKIIISKDDFVQILKFCNLNSFVLYDDKIFKQMKGIQMGSNYRPNDANLYLHSYEANESNYWSNKIQK